jgi:hypothetical protein
MIIFSLSNVNVSPAGNGNALTIILEKLGVPPPGTMNKFKLLWPTVGVAGLYVFTFETIKVVMAVLPLLVYNTVFAALIAVQVNAMFYP